MHSFTRTLSLENIEMVNERVKLLLSHGDVRTATMIQRYVHAESDPKKVRSDLDVYPNLKLDTRWADKPIAEVMADDHASFTALFDGTNSLSYSTRHKTNTAASNAWFHRGEGTHRGVATSVRVSGWGTEPWADDEIVVEQWNEYGVLRVTTIVFSWLKRADVTDE